MTIILIIFLLLSWLICGFLAAGTAYAFFQGSYPEFAEKDRRDDLGIAIFLGLFFGPLALVVIFFFSGFAKHGVWKVRK